MDARAKARARRRIAAAALVLLVLALGAGQGPAGGAVAQLENSLRADRMRADLVAFQRIADRTGGNRKAGSPGYAASVQYVRRELTRAGYRPRSLSFPFVAYDEDVERARQLAPRRRAFRVEAIDYSPSTRASGLRGRVVAADDGCEASDFGAVRGRIAIARRGACFIFVKARNAQAAGARALVVFNTDAGPLDATLGSPRASAIPVVAVPRSTATSLLSNATIELTVRTRTRRTTSQNVVADARPAAGRVLLVGAHLDSVVAGPGINDNATGVAALLEIARVVKQRSPALRVRFAFWGAEEFGLIGSSAYARTADLGTIVGYLNFDMLGSRTRERLRAVYTGQFAARWLEYFEAKGLPARTLDIGGRSDHAPFAQRGIPTGGLFAGIDPCYHRACDRVARVDLGLLMELAAGAAFGVETFAPR